MRTWVSWSSGKDAAMALTAVRAGRGAGSAAGSDAAGLDAAGLDVVGLVTTVDEDADVVPVHGVPRSLVAAQAAALGLALHVVRLPWPCPNAEYAARLGAVLDGPDGPDHVVVGDLHLADIRAFREELFAPLRPTLRFPLWGRDTAELARAVVGSGWRAVVVALDPGRVPADLLGAPFDERFLDRLPAGVDQCGENGEFHTFVVDGPDFRWPVEVDGGEPVTRDGLLVLPLRLR